MEREAESLDYVPYPEVKPMKAIGRKPSIVAAAAAALICMGAGEVKSDSAVLWPTHGWQKGTPADVGLDENILTGLDADLSAGKEGIVDSFQVFRCGEKVFERTYSHDYASIYGTEAKTKGPLNQGLTG